MSVQRKTALLFAAAMIIILAGFASIKLVSQTMLANRRSLLLEKPMPLPNGILSIYPLPGSQISASDFNDVSSHSTINQGGFICFQVAGDYGTSVIQSAFPFKVITLTINGQPSIQFLPKGAAHYQVEAVGDSKDTIRKICWYVQLQPGDYLITLNIHDESLAQIYEWAFRITD